MSEKIAVVGSGQMGNGIAHVFAVAGFDVMMIDVSRPALDRARATIERNLARQVEKKVIDASARDAALARIS
ncbi:MAG TPA: 3-hydroxyacyl-CoA dehydrogenase NAD-binding domain-containing protein, partial [Gemmatimonadaceae bacterium]|nr:3-hydroxyacyl-CoA dehydrogenase NAD-binding domain-containing protein [Gemmatimonadaceae bacterium]